MSDHVGRRAPSAPGTRRTTGAGLLLLAVAAGATAVLFAAAGSAAAAAPAPTPTPTPTPTSTPTVTPSATVTPSTSTAPQSGVAYSAEFEDITTDGFQGDPDTVVVGPSTTAYRGLGSLDVHNLTGYGQGATAHNLPATLPTGYYTAHAWVRLPAGTAQDMSLTFPGASRVGVIQTGISRSTSTGWVQLTTHFSLGGGTAAVPLRVEPVAHCSDARPTPLPFLLDAVELDYIGTVPPPFALLPTPACPLGPTNSPTHDTTPPPPPSPTCQVSAVNTAWPGGYQSTVKLTNLAPAPVTGWHLTFAVGEGQKVLSLWPTPYMQSGTLVTVTSPAWNPTLAPGASVSIGLVATRSNPEAVVVNGPHDFALNGVTCRSPIV